MRCSIVGSGSMAALLAAALGAAGMSVESGAIRSNVPARRDPPRYRPTPPKRDTEQQREIAEWNARIEQKRAEKLARKEARQ